MSLLIVRCVATALLSVAGVTGIVTHPVHAGPAASPYADEDLGARIVPAYRDDALVGFKVFAIQAGSRPARIGLQAGDLVTHVGGTAATTASQLVDAIAAFGSGASVNLTVERAGKTVALRS